MIPESAYPGPLPLNPEDALQLLNQLDDYEAVVGAFLTYVEIPYAEREGVYRFAGASRSLAAAVRRVDEFAMEVMGIIPQHDDSALRQLLEDCGTGRESHYPQDQAPMHPGVPHRLVFVSEYGAPMEGFGAFVVEIESLEGSPFENRPPEAEIPEEFDEPGE